MSPVIRTSSVSQHTTSCVRRVLFKHREKVAYRSVLQRIMKRNALRPLQHSKVLVMSIADCVEELLEDNITVKYFTTDCDSRANAAAGDCYKHHQKEHSPPRHLKDTQHVGRGQRRKIINTTFSHAMFPGRLAAQRAKSKQRFADDVVKI